MLANMNTYHFSPEHSGEKSKARGSTKQLVRFLTSFGEFEMTGTKQVIPNSFRDLKEWRVIVASHFILVRFHTNPLMQDYTVLRDSTSNLCANS
jgi:hypothetical protein